MSIANFRLLKNGNSYALFLHDVTSAFKFELRVRIFFSVAKMVSVVKQWYKNVSMQILTITRDVNKLIIIIIYVPAITISFTHLNLTK